MRRREVIGTLAALLPFPICSARAQVSANPSLIAILSTGSEADVRWKRLRGSFQRGLQEFGYAEDRHYILEERFAGGAHSRLPILADELVRLKPDIVIASSGNAALAVKNFTSQVPIVSPALVEGQGFANQARPGSNVTGILIASTELSGKQLDLTREFFTGAAKIGLLLNPGGPATEMQFRGAKTASAALSIELVAVEAQAADDFDDAFARLARAGVAAVLVVGDTHFFFVRHKIAAAALSARLPTMCVLREYVEAGGLMSYGVDLQENYRQIARYVDKILKGAKPADLPVELPAKFELVINLKTARALGLAISDSILTRADEVIE